MTEHTKFKGLKIGTHGSPGNEADYVTIDTSGTSQWSGPMGITGAQTVSGAQTVHGVLQQGDEGQRGTAIMVQRATIAANTTAGAPATIVLPSGSDIIDITTDVEIPFETAAGVSACNVEVSVAGGLGIAIMRVSASTTRYSLTSNADSFVGSALRNVTATIEAHASIVGSNTAMTAGQAMLTVQYIPGS